MHTLDEQQTTHFLKEVGLSAPSGTGFAFCDPHPRIFYGWHSHEYDQLLYSVHGMVHLETSDANYALPAARAAWIPAGLPHRTQLTDAEGISLYLAPSSSSPTEGRLRFLIVDTLLREMILHARRWQPGSAKDDAVAQSYFSTLSLICAERLTEEEPLRLPRVHDAAISRAMEYAIANLAQAQATQAAAAAHLSERSLRRRFSEVTGMSWQNWLTQAKILTAMRLLAEGERVTETALQVGFSSLSAFAQAFARITGETPSAYRTRLYRRH
ncbi:AraC-like DNA-binding protein [Rhizomicrobium palustre]|uniref:AraC-like DNA-binding protein n=1 Tax=Rhizomicrobium palustre TaxID=189966 RepID=A0A846N374_9PROT|nr:helix-turn-helix transcriptional regulator [Rhizomicrobium palustre]NIK89672.1 AraC-like DNA-binding protein [Rhizomicrobium palustre]